MCVSDKCLHDVLEKVEQCGYFTHPPHAQEEEEVGVARGMVDYCNSWVCSNGGSCLVGIDTEA